MSIKSKFKSFVSKRLIVWIVTMFVPMLCAKLSLPDEVCSSVINWLIATGATFIAGDSVVAAVREFKNGGK